jgi:MoaA/NifB/PqqE/SkfB family radical SAM enzyme
MSFYDLPFMVMANSEGQVFEHPVLRMVGRTGTEHRPPEPGELMDLPAGSDLHVLPGRHPIGVDPATGSLRTIHNYEGQTVNAVSSFLAPAHTVFLWSAFERTQDAPVLPLYAYAALGWRPEGFITAGRRVDPDPRQDLDNFPQGGEEDNRADKMVRDNEGNRLIKHLSHCCIVYRCPAARNYFLGRYEAPLPTSTGCNAACLGCISLQEDTGIPCTQDRIDFVPTPEEIAEVALGHIERAESPIVSFGQGCEGEPLTNWKTLMEAITLIRKRTSEGTINLNTNASMPRALEYLFDAGLDSIRVSLNSARKDLYTRYFKPVNYSFDDVVDSMDVAHKKNRFVSVNYFVFPGITDEADELEAISQLQERTRFDMIQWRNLNIDPDVYLEALGRKLTPALGVGRVMDRLKECYPALRYGYFNPALQK